jgi:hypothetical protein
MLITKGKVDASARKVPRAISSTMTLTPPARSNGIGEEERES